MVTATKPKTRMTADELLAMPDDGYRYELVRGELIKMSPTGWGHGVFASRIDRSMGTYASDNRLGEASTENGFLIGTDHMRAPDVSLVRRERALDPNETSGFFPGPPDIAVEVISPSDRLTEVAEKVEEWLDAGTLAVIVANPRNQTVRVHRPDWETIHLTVEDVLEVPEVLPGWRMPIREIFRVA